MGRLRAEGPLEVPIMGSERTNRSVAPAAWLRGRKKFGLAAALAVVMGIMWVRVLIGHKPQAASAAAEAPAPAKAANPIQPPTKVKYLNLPVIPGRNDTIERDFFAGGDWNGFPRSPSPATTSVDTEVVQPPVDRTSENVGKVAQRLNLQAVFVTGSPEAFINDQLLHKGDALSFQDGADLYLFEVKQIHDDSVLVECRGQQLTLKMK
jgi:hypothetical protein